MQNIHRVDVKVKPGDIDRQFRKALKAYVAGDDAALVSFQAEFPDNEHVQALVDAARHERAEIEYEAWKAGIHEMAGCS